MSFLEIRDLTFTYPGEIRAVDSFDFDARQGEFVALIGPNAAGKSTLALLLKGLVKAEKGFVRIDGEERPLEGTDPRVGLLFANPENQLITSIVEEDIAFGLEVFRRPSEEIADRVQNILDRMGIRHLSGRMPHLLSGGEQQMVALAGALVQEPDILVLDEPTTFLDPDGRAAVIAAMRGLADQGKVVVLITHDMSEAALADRIVLMGEGRMVQDGPPMDLFSRRDISTRFGITPPFLVRLALSISGRGYPVTGPLTVGGMASALTALTRGRWGGGAGSREGPVPDKNAVPSALSFEGIRFRYGLPSEGGKELMSDLDLAVPEGSIAMLCGPNGSGKSTLLQMANGLIEPDEGRVAYRGRSLGVLRKESGSIYSRIVLLFQNPERQLFSETVFEDIAFGPRNLGLNASETEKRVEEAARWAGIGEEILHRPVHTLSGGQMRRVAVAGVLAMDPAVLVLDEPTDSLDPGGVKEFYDGMRQYCGQKGTTILMSAHSVPEEIRYIDHFSHLENGRIHSSGPPGAVLAGRARTLPARYLPDHLLLQDHLTATGEAAQRVELDPFLLEEKLLETIDL
jgi:energy-coupling factor transport system ATP-binding protein